jgi:ADP-ribose pyrophosphatase
MKPKKRGPWTLLDSRVVYKSSWMEVRKDKVLTPTGKNDTYGRIKLKSGVTVIALDSKMNVYLTSEYHYGVDKVTLEAVSGGMEKNQTKLGTAKAELMEEAGLKAKKWTFLGETNALTTYLSGPTYLYLAEGLTQHEPNLEETETLEIVKMPLKKALRLIEEGEINHSSTVVALLKTAILKKIK